MRWSFATVGIIILGLFGLVIIILFHEITVSNEQDYYTLKEATEAALIEAVDVAYYRLTGEIKISQEKFVENFTRRFTETSTFGQGNYSIYFYQISETPAKVSVRIVDNTNSYNIYTNFNPDLKDTNVNIINEISAVLDGLKIDITVDEVAKKLTAKEAKECKKNADMAPQMDCTPQGISADQKNYVTVYDNNTKVCNFKWDYEQTWSAHYAPRIKCDALHKYDSISNLCVCKDS